ncbi:MAG: hypothetical protein HQK78_18535 [Desulfobacterales bacterium]|nr:hypothetical protein [Desulfobacterales bacterium]
MKAKLIEHTKVTDEYDNIIEIKVWSVRKSPDKPHGYKYSLVYIANNKRTIGYDNAEQKGDHRHYEAIEEPYSFSSLRKLADDFFDDIETYKRKHYES